MGGGHNPSNWERVGALLWGEGRASDGHRGVPEPERETAPTARGLPLKILTTFVFSPSSVPSRPLPPGFPASAIFLLFLPSLALLLPGPQIPGILKGAEL